MSLGAYLFVIRGNDYDLPYRETITSLLQFCDEVLVGTDPRVKDGTLAELENMAEKQPNLRLEVCEFDYDNPSPLRLIKQSLRNKLKTDWLLEVDADEFLMPHSHDLIRELSREISRQRYAYAFGLVNFFNGSHVNLDMPRLRFMMTRNLPEIRHIGPGRIGTELKISGNLPFKLEMRKNKLKKFRRFVHPHAMQDWVSRQRILKRRWFKWYISD